VSSAAPRIVDIINLSSSADTLLRERVRAMRERGFDNRILCIDGPQVAALRAAGIPVHTVHLPRGFDPLRLLVALVEITAYLVRERVDLVHTHCSVPGVVGRIAAWLARVPVIVHTVHGFHLHEGMPCPLRRLTIGIERLCGAVTDTLLTQNRSDLGLAELYDIGPRERRRLIGNGIQLERFRPSLRAGAPGGAGSGGVAGPMTVTCVARLEPVKNHPMLFEAAAILRQRGEPIRLRLVGDGPLRAAYQERCRRLGIEADVEFLGYRSDIPELLAASDVAVLTSHKEGIPRAALEAMAMAVPVVATRVTGTQEVVRHGETGVLVEPGDVDGLAGALALLAGDPLLRAGMGARGRRVVVEEFDEQSVIESLRRVYQARLLARLGARPEPAFAWGEDVEAQPRVRR